MIEIKIHAIVGQVLIDARFVSDSGETGTKVRWQGSLDDSAPLDDLTSMVTNALEALDREMGEVHAMVLFGSG